MADTARTLGALGRALDTRYTHDDEILGIHCRDDGYLATMGLSDHSKCAGWWQSDTVDGQPVGFRCTCTCHDR